METRGHSQNGMTNMEMGGRDSVEVLVTTHKKNKRILKWIAFAIILLAILAGLFFLLLKEKKEDTRPPVALKHSPTISLEEILSDSLTARPFNGTWLTDTTFAYRHEDYLMVKNVTSDHPKKVYNIGDYSDFEFSPDGKYLLVSFDRQKRYRYSSWAKYRVINLETSAIINITTDKQAMLQRVMWTPEKNGLVFIADGNIYYKPKPDMQPIKLTENGDGRRIIHGLADWVYEEEILDSDQAMWVSPDGNYLAFATFDESFVPQVFIPLYGPSPVPNASLQYPLILPLYYPKPGTPNPIVNLSVISLSASENYKLISVPTVLNRPKQFREPVLSRVEWANNSTVVAIWLNRVQNESNVVMCSVPFVTGECETLMNKSQIGGWIDSYKPVMGENGEEIAIIMSVDQGGDSGSYKHIVIVNRTGHERSVTQGNFDVTDFLGWDTSRNDVYYVASVADNSKSRHIYKISANKTAVMHTPMCLSCDLRSGDLKCSYAGGECSKGFSYCAIDCKGPGVPQTTLVKTDNGAHVDILEDNADITELLRGKALPSKQYMQVATKGGFMADVYLRLPPHAVLDGSVKYPMLLYVYAGPSSVMVHERHGFAWEDYMVANKNMVVVCIDGRGSAKKGDKNLFAIYRGLGTVEIEDQAEVTEYLVSNLSYIDPERVAVWGWSYGGYASLMTSLKSPRIRCTIAVSPVADWKLYDSIYTERYMGLPVRDNDVGYANNRLISRAKDFRGKSFMIAHGTLDDNVHYQQFLLLLRELELLDIDFRQVTYTDEVHSLSFVRPHLYHSMEKYLDECLDNVSDS